MSDAAMTSLANKLTTYAGLPILVAGVIGGFFNTIIFLSLKTFRKRSCAFFLTVMSVVNIGQLITALRSRIAIDGFGIDWTESSLFYCKARSFLLQFFALTSFSCMCLATIDQFLATSLRPRWQNFITLKRACIYSVAFIALWTLHGIPSVIWYELILPSPTSQVVCRITNPAFQIYINNGYVLLLTGVLPVSITLLFGSLAYRNVRQIPYRTIPLVRRELDKQLTSMVLVQIVYNFIVLLPYLTVLIVTRSINLVGRSSVDDTLSFYLSVTNIIHFLYYAVSRFSAERLLLTDVLSESILHLCLCLETIPSAVRLRHLRQVHQMVETSDHVRQSDLTVIILDVEMSGRIEGQHAPRTYSISNKLPFGSNMSFDEISSDWQIDYAWLSETFDSDTIRVLLKRIAIFSSHQTTNLLTHVWWMSSALTNTESEVLFSIKWKNTRRLGQWRLPKVETISRQRW